MRDFRLPVSGLLLVLTTGCGAEPEQVTGPGHPLQPEAPIPGYYTLVVDEVKELIGAAGGRWSEAHDINAGGVVVGAFRYQSGKQRAGRWNPGTNAVDMGTLFGGTSEAWGVNDNGLVVGNSVFEGETRRHPVLWDQSGPPQELPVIGVTMPGTFGPSIEATARSISNTGLITGTSWLNNGGSVSGAYLLQGATPLLIPSDCLSVGDAYLGGDGNAVNNAGQVAASLLCPTNFSYGAARLTTSTTLSLGDFVDNSSSGAGLGINTAGQVVGRADWQPAPGQGPTRKHAFRWVSSTLIDLHTPGDTKYSSEGYDINSQRIVVGRKWDPAGSQSWAFVQGWGVPMTVLPQLGTRLGGPVGAIAYAINDDNTAVGASYTTSGEWHATQWKFHFVFHQTGLTK